MLNGVNTVYYAYLGCIFRYGHTTSSESTESKIEANVGREAAKHHHSSGRGKIVATKNHLTIVSCRNSKTLTYGNET